MAGTWNPSWISGKYAYTFASDYAKITANTTLDITGSFRLGFQLKFDQLFLTGTIWSKSTGDVNDPLVTSYNIHSINGYLRVMISDGTKFLVYDTTERFFATYKAVQVDIVWDSVNKELKVYKDAVNKTIVLNTTETFYYASPASFTTLLTTPTADLNFGKGQGQESFKGTLGGAIFSSRTFTSPEIYSYYLGKEDNVSTPPPTEILFISDSNGQNNIYKMYEDGSLPTQAINSSNNLQYATWNNAKTRLNYSDITNSFCRTKNLTTAVDTRNSPSKYSSLSPTNANKMVTSYYNRTGIGYYNLNLADPETQDSFEPAITPNHATSTYHQEFFNSYSPDGTKITVVKQDIFNAIFALAEYDSDLAETSLRFIYETTGSKPIDTFCYSPNGLKIAFSMKDGTKYQIYTINVDGTGLTQITAESNDCKFPVYSPNGLKIAFAVKNGSSNTKFQTHLMNNNGSNIVRVSNNAYNEYPSDWK